MQSPFVLPPEDSRRLCCWGKVWTDMGSWALIQMLVSFFFLLVKRKQERVCQVWRSFDYSLWGLHVFFTWSQKWENWGEVGEDVWKQGLYLTLSCTFNNLVSEPCPSSQNFDGAGHALFIDNNCCRTSKGAHSQAREVEGTLRGKDGTQQLLGASSEPCQKCLIVPTPCSKWPKPFMSIPEVQLSAKAGDPSGLSLPFWQDLTNSHIYQIHSWPLETMISRKWTPNSHLKSLKRNKKKKKKEKEGEKPVCMGDWIAALP